MLRDFQIDNVQYGVLASVGSWAAVVTTVLGGVLADRYGYPRVMLGAQVMTVIGVLVQSLSAAHAHFGWMVTGRVTFVYVSTGGGEEAGQVREGGRALTTCVRVWNHEQHWERDDVGDAGHHHCGVVL